MTSYPGASKKEKSEIVELNKADTAALKYLRGIGSFYARKIVEYREKLGGYYSTEQLKELWKIRPGLVDTISAFLTVDTLLIERININTIDVTTLSRHPYLEKNQAKALIAYRDQHGLFQSIEDIKKCTLIDQSTFNRMKKYISIE